MYFWVVLLWALVIDPAVTVDKQDVRVTRSSRFDAGKRMVLEVPIMANQGRLGVVVAGRPQVTTYEIAQSSSDTSEKEYKPPSFTNCPPLKIVTYDLRYQLPTLTATDESGTPTITKEQGPAGPVFSVGVHVFTYRATDKYDNSIKCTFMLEVRAVDCEAPEHEDQDAILTCNGHAHGSVCQLSCKSGTSVEGDGYIHCVTDNSTTENKSHWQPVTGEPGKCFKKKCDNLPAPRRGALICDVTSGGTLCQVMCGRSYDVRRGDGFATTYICSASNSEWKPWSNVADCIQYKSIIMNLPNKDYYFDGDCSGAMDQIRKNFVKNMKKLKIQTCNGKKCTDDQLDVTCGGDIDNIWEKRKRSVVVQTLDPNMPISSQFRAPTPNKARKFGAPNPNRKGRFGASRGHRRLFKLGVDMSNVIDNVTIEDLAFGYSTSFPWDTDTTEDTTDCRGGQVLSGDQCKPCPSGFYKLGKTCIPCPEGTYRDESGGRRCHKCAVGRNTSFVASTSNDCVPLCRKHTFSRDGRPPCFPCLTGTCQGKVGARTCRPCKAGRRISEFLNPAVTGMNFKVMDDLTKEPDLTNRLIANFLLDCQSRVCRVSKRKMLRKLNRKIEKNQSRQNAAQNS